MASVFDVAKYILGKTGAVTTWKLQKLVYYSQAWSTVWDDKPLFDEPIQAWANGPVCPDLYKVHRGKFKIDELPRGSAKHLTASQKETIDKIVNYYGKKSAHYLSLLTHMEGPWREARGDLPPGERGNSVITLDSMAEYYGGL